MTVIIEGQPFNSDQAKTFDSINQLLEGIDDEVKLSILANILAFQVTNFVAARKGGLDTAGAVLERLANDAMTMISINAGGEAEAAGVPKIAELLAKAKRQ